MGLIPGGYAHLYQVALRGPIPLGSTTIDTPISMVYYKNGKGVQKSWQLYSLVELRVIYPEPETKRPIRKERSFCFT